MAYRRQEDSALENVWKDFDSQRKKEQGRFFARRPQQLGKVLAQLVSQRGYAQIQAVGEQEEAWQSVVGEELASQTRFSSLRRGAFEVVVANSLLMQELTFRKAELLAKLQQTFPEAGIKQLRLKVGTMAPT